ncbi:MAG: hypothetical protein HZA17_04055 [Nitrospirae bacterium]|nr:hypothetical protein [Nitrospirota bacterium]
MTYSESIKNGFRLINKRWQLVLVQAGLMVFNLIGFFIMVGIPLGIAFIIFGLDLTGIAQIGDIFDILRNPAELLSRYFGLVLLVLASFLVYILIITTVGIFVFCGSVGIIGRSVLDPSLKFSMRAFFDEAKRFFFPLMWYSLLIGLVFIAIAFVLGLLGGGVAAVVTAAKSQDSTLALFLGIFFSLIVVVIGLGLILGSLAVTVYGIAALFFRGEGSWKSFKGALGFLWENQNAFWLCAILFIGYILVSFAVMLVIYPFDLIPIIGTIISFPFRIISYVAQGYLYLVIIAAIFSYYYEHEIKKAQASSGPETITEPPAAAPASQEDTFGSQAPEQESPPQEEDRTAQT